MIFFNVRFITEALHCHIIEVNCNFFPKTNTRSIRKGYIIFKKGIYYFKGFIFPGIETYVIHDVIHFFNLLTKIVLEWYTLFILFGFS